MKRHLAAISVAGAFAAALLVPAASADPVHAKNAFTVQATCVTRTLTAVTHWGSRRAIAAARPALQQLQVAAVTEGLHPLETHHLHLFAAAHAPRRPAAAH